MRTFRGILSTLIGMILLALTACSPKPTTVTSASYPGGVVINTTAPLPTIQISTTLPTSPPAIPASGGSANPVLAALRTQYAAKAYQARTIMKKADGSQINEIDAKYIAPDTYDLILANKAEYLFTGGKTYIKREDGKWAVSPVDIGSLIKSFRDEDLLAHIDQYIQNVEKVGTDALDGKPMTVYSYQTNFGGITGSSKLWIGADHLPYQQEGTSTYNGESYQTRSIYTYDPNITIATPEVP